MRSFSTGFGLCIAGLGVALQPVVERALTSSAQAHPGGPSSALTAVVLGQSTPTIVWYGTNSYTQVLGSGTGARQAACSEILRGWSDGRIEVMTTRREMTGYNGSQFDAWCTTGGYCTTPWTLVSTPAQGYAAEADINADTSVDGADFSILMASWGDAPRHAVSPSECPLDLVSP